MQMVDVRATNQKLKERARRIIRQCCQSSLPISDDELDLLLARCNGSVKLAIASLRLGVSAAEAQHLLQRSGGILASIVSDHGNIAATHGDVLASARYVLCVDGGGSKCAVFILGSNGEAGSATAPSCNV
jgi:N-acetylmuramic acid 6-phosphate etherase